MNTCDFANMAEFAVLVDAGSRPLTSVYCADLLSWAMAKAPAGAAWCTVMGNVNAVAVAALTEVGAIALCEGAVFDDNARAKAEAEGIFVVRTDLPAFEAGLAIAKRAGLYAGDAAQSPAPPG